jgi:hypothetical protein
MTKIEGNIEYIGIDYNKSCCDLFDINMDECRDKRTRILVKNCRIQDALEKEADLVHGTHMLYYDKDYNSIIEYMIGLTKTEGETLILNAPSQGLSDYFRVAMCLLNDIEVPLSDQVMDSKSVRETRHSKETINCTADLTECFQESESAIDILSFICHADIRSNPANDISEFRKHLRDISYERNGYIYAEHNVDAITIF